ncbi:MAG: rod shape-determining protein MreC [Porphyromonas sp.]|nr:rod shape-determining protein MreC [Porphyromonas sp.]
MQKLLSFIIEKRHWFLLLLLLSFSLNLYLRHGLYRQGLRLYAQSWLSGYTNQAMTYGYSYLDLKEHNEALLAENARLEHDLVVLRRYLADVEANSTLPPGVMSDSTGLSHSFVTARIVNVRNQQGEAYYIINKGSNHGVKVDMPVMSATGVMGMVMELSGNFSVVIPITNPRVKISAMVKGKEYKGDVSSLGYNRPAYLGGVPLQATINKGDTVLTSGYSYVFPEGLMVGIVETQDQSLAAGHSKAFGAFRLRLSTDFDKLNHVYVLLTPPMHEAQELENRISEQDEQ